MTDWLQFSHIYNEQNQIRNSCLGSLSNLSISGSRVPWQLKKCLTDFYRECKRVPLTWTPNDVPMAAKCVNFCLASLRPCACATSDRLFMWDDAVEFAPLLLWFVDLTLYFAPLLEIRPDWCWANRRNWLVSLTKKNWLFFSKKYSEFQNEFIWCDELFLFSLDLDGRLWW